MPSLKNASKKASAKYNANKPNAGAVAGLGVSKSQVVTEDLLSSMEIAIANFIQRVIENIDKAVGKTGDPLINTGEITNITAEQTDNGWSISAPPQLDFQSKGVSGTQRKVAGTPYAFSGSAKAVDIKAIKLWVQQRGIVWEGYTEDQVVYVLSKRIYEQGIDPKNLWENEVQQLEDEAGELVAQQIVNSIGSSTTKKDIKIK